MDKVKTEDLIKELEKRGFKWGYVWGHGQEEYASEREYVIADLEKVNVLIRPEDLFEEPIHQDKIW